MSFAVIIRDYIEYFIPLFHQTNELTKNNELNLYRDFFRSFVIFLEVKIPSRFRSLISFQWVQDMVYLPILRPETQIAQTNSRIFSRVPFNSSELFPKNLNFFTLTNIRVPTNSFQTGFLNSFFLTCPISIIFLINIHRYWIQGFVYGFLGTIGYRFGEALLLIRFTNGYGFLWYTNNSTIQFRINLLISIYFLQESFNNRVFSQTKKKRQTNQLEIKTRIIIIILHRRYRFSDHRVFFSVIRNQTLDTYSFNSILSYFSITDSIYISYILGIFLGGLFFDLLIVSILFRRTEYSFIKLRVPPLDWKKKINIWTKRIRVGYILRTIPFYRTDNLIFSSVGFFGRDTELRRHVSRNIFSYPSDPGKSLSHFFEGRNILGEDNYGRSAPDIIREPPWLLSRLLTTELRHDLIDETYRTQIVSQRVDIIYLGTLERKISEWLEVRSEKSRDESRKLINKEKKKEKKSILVKESIRKGLRSNLTSINIKNPPLDLDPLINRFNHWFRATYNMLNIQTRDKVPNSLFALYMRSSPFIPSFWAPSEKLESDQPVRYSKSEEFFRKRNARQSLLHRRPIFLYIDSFINTRSPQIGFLRDRTTRQQQNDLYRARLVLHNYVKSLRRYCEINSDFLADQEKSKRVTPVLQRVSWQQKILENIFGGNRSRRNSVYNQQYIGNIQLIRRLFSVSWSSSEHLIPFRLQTKEIKKKIIKRRKITLDQRTFDRQKNIFEHEEIGKATPLKVKNNEERKQIFDLFERKSKKFERWALIKRKKYIPDFRVRRNPLYAGWDAQRNAFILCNRYLPFEWSIRTKLRIEDKINRFSIYFKNLNKYPYDKNRVEFTFWPKNPKTRRIHLHSLHYNRQSFLKRRRSQNTENKLTDLSFLSQDPSYWRKKIGIETSLIINFHPHTSRKRLVRNSQRYPISLERSFSLNYSPRVNQPSPRGGLAWPGSNSFILIQEKFYRPRYVKL